MGSQLLRTLSPSCQEREELGKLALEPGLCLCVDRGLGGGFLRVLGLSPEASV